MLFSSEHECKIIVIFMKMEVTVRRQMGGSDTQSRSKKIDGYIFVYTNANHIAWLFYHISFHLLQLYNIKAAMSPYIAFSGNVTGYQKKKKNQSESF